MARPLKRTVDYFPHFVTTGKTLLILQNEFGNDGYAFWFKLLALLCKSDGLVYDYNNPASWRLLLAETHVSEDIATKILALLAEIEAIDPDLYLTKIIWVQNLVDNLGDVFIRRRNGSIPERPVNANNNSVNVNSNTQTRLYQTKPEETRENTAAANLDPRLALLVTLYEENIGEIKPMLAEDMIAFLDEYTGPESWFADAFKEAVKANVRQWRYVRAILLDWQTKGKRGTAPKLSQKFLDSL